MPKTSWFKVWHSARTDKRLSVLSLAERGVWMNLLCFASEQEQRGALDASDRFVLAVDCADGDEIILNSTIEKLLRVRHLVQRDDGRIAFRTWDIDQSPELEEMRAEFNKMQPAAMAALIERDGAECHYCGATVRLTVDHVVPLSRHGPNTLDNLVIACRSCNSAKN